MGLAETAELAVLLKLGTSGSFAGATSEINAVERAAMTGGRSTHFLSNALGVAGGAAGKFGGALSHAKGAVGELLTGPLGVLGLAGGVGGLGIAFEKVISHTNEFAFANEKLMNLTGGTAESMSTLLAVFEKFNIDAQRTGQIVGFAEKTLGNLSKVSADGTIKLRELDKEYGLHLINAKGKLVDFETELKQVANVYTSSIDPAQKAALAAKLFGRGYADLVPILALGSKGITEAEQAAKDLGLTLTAQNAKDLKQYRESLRETGDAIGGLELQIGLALVPAIKDMADGITHFLKSGGREQLVNFFKEVVSAARGFAGFVTGTLIPVVGSIAGAVKTAVSAIPPWLQDLLVKGFVANKAAKFVFGIDVVGSIGDVLKKALVGSLAEQGIGKLFVQPVFVTNPGFGGGLPGLAGGAAAEGAAVAEGAGGLTLGAAAGAAAIGTAIAGATFAALTLAYNATATEAQKAALQPTVNADQAFKHNFGRLPTGMVDPAGRYPSTFALTGKTADDIALGTTLSAQRLQDVKDASQGTAREIVHLGRRMLEIAGVLRNLEKARRPADVAHAVKAAIAEFIGRRQGNVGDTKTLLGDLKDQLARTHDPKLEAALKAAISKVEHKLAAREVIAGILVKADKIAGSTESTKDKIKDLKDLQAQVGKHSDAAAARIQHQIDAAKAAQVAATAAATAAVKADTQAIKDKDLSVTVPVTVPISIRDVINGQATLSRYTSVAKQVGTA